MGLPLFILAAFTLSGGPAQTLDGYLAIRPFHIGWFTIGMLASYGLGDSLFIWSSRSLGVPGALAIASCYPLWTVLAGHLFGNQEISSQQLLGLLITLAGLVLVVLNIPGKVKGSTGPHLSPIGIILALVTSFAWAANSYAVSIAGTDINPWAGNTVRMTLSLLFCGVVGRIFASHSPLFIPVPQIRKFWWVFVIEAFGGSACYFYGMSHSPLAVGSTLSSLSPVLAVPVALILKLEKFSAARTFGVSLVVLGLWLLISNTYLVR